MNKKRFGCGLVLIWLAFAAGCAEPMPEELMSRAQQALSDGQPRTAEIHLKNLLRQAPDDAAARALLGQVSLALGDPVAAGADLRRALELGADPATLQVPLLRALAGEGEFAALLKQIDEGPELQGDDRTVVLRLAGAAHRALKQPEEAEAAYRSALAIDPNSADVRADLAALMLDQNRVPEARQLIVAVLADRPDFGPALLLRGQLEFVQRRFAEAEATYRRVIQLEGPKGNEYFAASSQLVQAMLAQGSVDEAAEAADELVAAFPAQPVSTVLKASVEMQQGALDDARRRLEALVADAPTYAPANRLLGAINAKQGRAGQARMYLQSALTADPNDRRAMLYLAGLQVEQGDVDGAKKLLADAVKPAQPTSDAVLFALAGRASLQARQDDLAAQFFGRSAQSLSDDPQEVVEVASVYAASGELARAADLLEGPSSVDAENSWRASYLLALTQVRQGDLKAADASAERLSSQQPDVPWPLNFRGSIALLAKDLTAARRYYSAALDVDPKYVSAMLGLARVDVQEGKPEQAAGNFRRILEVAPEDAGAKLGLAELALRRGDYAEARQWLDQAPDSTARARLEASLALAQGRFDEAADGFARVFQTAPSAEAALQAYASALRASRPAPESPLLAWLAEHPRDLRMNFALGSLALERGDYDAAISRYETVTAVDPKQAEALNNLAWLYDKKGDDRALDAARQAHEAAPDNPLITDTLGWLEVQRGDAAAGLPLLEQSRQARPDNAEIHYHWAAALAKTGSADRAADELRKLLSEDTGFEGREEAERLLKELE